MKRLIPIIAASLLLGACAGGAGGGLGGTGGYSLVRVKPVAVGNNKMIVTPTREWNRLSSQVIRDVDAVEDWSQHGPILDTLSFVSGLKDGKDLVPQYKRDTRQVPKFDARMTAPEIAAMLESFYRTRAGTVDFEMLELKPRTFLGREGFQFDFQHLDGDELWRRGRAVGAVVDGRLYLILLDAARSHYFDELAPEFEAITNSARLQN